jgi:hypothetical protein
MGAGQCPTLCGHVHAAFPCRMAERLSGRCAFRRHLPQAPLHAGGSELESWHAFVSCSAACHASSLVIHWSCTVANRAMWHVVERMVQRTPPAFAARVFACGWRIEEPLKFVTRFAVRAHPWKVGRLAHLRALQAAMAPKVLRRPAAGLPAVRRRPAAAESRPRGGFQARLAALTLAVERERMRRADLEATAMRLLARAQADLERTRAALADERRAAEASAQERFARVLERPRGWR